MNRALLLLLGGLGLANPTVASPVAGVNDSGHYIIYHQNQAVGAENFSILTQGDSIAIFAQSYQTLRSQRGEEKFEKQLTMVADAFDYGIRSYQSRQKFGGQELTRALVMMDTTFTCYREIDGHGSGLGYVRPPGRLFVIDSQLFTLFDVICRNLHGRPFDQRPIELLVFGPRDTLLEATATNLGTETLRWGARPVVAHKLGISDANTKFVAWLAPDGSMLRLEDGGGLRVMREPPVVKRRPRAPHAAPPDSLQTSAPPASSPRRASPASGLKHKP